MKGVDAAISGASAKLACRIIRKPNAVVASIVVGDDQLVKRPHSSERLYFDNQTSMTAVGRGVT
jgi:hypothetical protein